MIGKNFPARLKRQYLPEKFDASQKKWVMSILNELIENIPQNFASASRWFGLFHEFSCAISEEHTRLELALNLENNKSNETKLEEFERDILTELLNNREQMMDIYLNNPFKTSMHSYDGGKLEREIRAKKKYAHPSLSSLQMEENKMIREYKKFTQFARVPYEGENVSLSVLIGKMHHSEENVRKSSFYAYWNFVKEQIKEFEGYFQQLYENRRKQALVVGCSNYANLAFADLGRMDYGLNDCATFRQSILQSVVPVVTKLSEKQKENYAQKTIEPWNASHWPNFSPQSAPCGGNFEKLVVEIEKIVEKVHPMFGELFAEMRKQKLMDLIPKKGKSSGAFSVTLAESKTPFLFGNFSANYRDIFTLLHEFGHCLHGSAVSQINNILLRHPGFEFCELASMGMELLARKFVPQLWVNPSEGKKALQFDMFQKLQFWPFMAMMDQWQHTIYAEEKYINPLERNRFWKDVSQQYKPHVDWSCCPEFEEYGWVARHHVFTSPFYFIDYGIAQMGALSLWLASKENYAQAIEKYIEGLSLGAQLSLPDLFKKIGAPFDFSNQILEKFCREMLKEIIC